MLLQNLIDSVSWELHCVNSSVQSLFLYYIVNNCLMKYTLYRKHSSVLFHSIVIVTLFIFLHRSSFNLLELVEDDARYEHNYQWYNKGYR